MVHKATLPLTGNQENTQETHLKLIKTQSRLEQVFEEYSGKIESFAQMLDLLKEGVVIINKNSEIYFSNARANAVLSDVVYGNKVQNFLSYRDLAVEEVFELESEKNHHLTIRVASFYWGEEQTNIFVIEKSKVVTELAPRSDRYPLVTSLLNTISGNFLLMKNNRIEFACNEALKTLLLSEDGIREKLLSEIFTPQDEMFNSLTDLAQAGDQNMIGTVHLGAGSAIPAKSRIRQLKIDNEVYQLFSFEPVKVHTPLEIISSKPESPDPKPENSLLEHKDGLLDYIRLITESQNKGEIDDAKRYTGFAKQEIAKVGSRLAAVKSYLMLAEHPLLLSPVSIKTLLSGLLETLRPELEAAGAEVNISDLPQVNADSELIVLLFTQLIDNAIKFARKDRKPVIDIGTDMIDGDVILCVRDNGIGISKKYHTQIFGLFEKLHSADEYPGIGLGLNIAQRIVEMHGGRLWVESLPGHGSSFYFTLKGA